MSKLRWMVQALVLGLLLPGATMAMRAKIVDQVDRVTPVVQLESKYYLCRVAPEACIMVGMPLIPTFYPDCFWRRFARNFL